MGAALDEQAIIAEILAPLATAPGAFGLTDDAAIVACPPGFELVVSQDTLAADVHFHQNDPAELIARKALRVNLSDLAAKAADPVAYFLSLALAPGQSLEWVRGFAAGLAADQQEFGITLHGGDTVAAPGGPVITVTVIGSCPQGAMMRRTGARPGDLIYVSGTIGDGALGLLQLRGGDADGPLARRYLLPQPRLALIAPLRAHASAAMDISDGLAIDLARMMRVSGCSAEVNCESVPISAQARSFIGASEDLLDRALTGGDDYEILCAINPEQCHGFENASRGAGIAVTCIGRVRAGAGAVAFVDTQGQPRAIADHAYRHFSRP